jgi:hypothetical protein
MFGQCASLNFSIDKVCSNSLIPKSPVAEEINNFFKEDKVFSMEPSS